MIHRLVGLIWLHLRRQVRVHPALLYTLDRRTYSFEVSRPDGVVEEPGSVVFS
jgi:hypothetical protein